MQTPRPFAILIALSLCTLAALAPPSHPAEPLPSWPQFRGPSGDGIVAPPGTLVGLPQHWSETENVLWKTPIHDIGWSTPVAMEGKIWLTTATREGNDFFALAIDAESGKIVLDQKLFHSDNPEPLGNNVNGYASPSPAIEPGRVYLNFGSYGTACLDASNGAVLWSRNDLPCRHYRGPGSSIILFENLLIHTFDGVDLQYVVALDKTTGKTVWKTDRSVDYKDLTDEGIPFSDGDLRKAFTTPIVIEWDGKKQLINPGSRAMYGYDPHTGREIWRVAHDGFSTSTSTVFNNGLAYITTGHGNTQLWAVRVDGEGDVANSHVAWKVGSKDVPLTPSPITVDDLLFMVSDTGAVTCLEAATGTEVWRKRIPGGYVASPIYADGNLYFFSQTAKTTILKAARTFEEIAENELDGSFMSSPAVYNNSLILRTKTDLYRIGKK